MGRLGGGGGIVVVREDSCHKFILSQSEVSKKHLNETIGNCSGTFHSSAEAKFFTLHQLHIPIVLNMCKESFVHLVFLKSMPVRHCD